MGCRGRACSYIFLAIESVVLWQEERKKTLHKCALAIIGNLWGTGGWGLFLTLLFFLIWPLEVCVLCSVAGIPFSSYCFMYFFPAGVV